jgi:uncharacterized protein YgbK (DUF1537 family)
MGAARLRRYTARARHLPAETDLPMPLLLGCIADDFTGATDLANTLVQGGMTAVQVIGVPDGALPEADAVIVALKSRTAPARDAVAWSLAACEALLAAGARQILFKYCSTFDSTEHGNIGPVADALAKRLDAGFALATPAFPTNGRTVFQGHLFVGQALLSESGMEHHPLTPMRDPNLVRVLARQTEGTVGLVPFAVVEQGAPAIRAAMTRLKEGGRRYAIVDAATDAHLLAIGEAAAGHPLITGGSGVAMGLPANFRRAGLLPERGATAAALPPPRGHAAVLAGSCSRATLGQIGFARDRAPTLELDALATPDAAALAAQALDWAAGRLGAAPIVIAASAPPEAVAALQARLGRAAAGALVEQAMAAIAAGLVARGVGRLVVAGGETAGAVVQRLGVTALRIGPEIDPGVPWTWAEQAALHLALKSGNFGGRDFFLRAFDVPLGGAG